MNRHLRHMILLSFTLLCLACNPQWEEHYKGYEVEVDMDLWEVVKSKPEYSEYVKLMEQYGLDSLMTSGLSLTLFIPGNDKFQDMRDTTDFMNAILQHHISNTVFLTRNVEGSRKLETFGEKFPLVEEGPEGYSYDQVPIAYNSPIFRNGVYYELDEIAYPRPNLYQFTDLYSPVIKDYIDLTDSVYLDKSQSTPLGFDDDDNTVYDSVFGVVNRFERDYFPVSKEFRDKTATFVLFTQEQYDGALDIMADILGDAFMDHEDIPEQWQNEVLLPTSLASSLFDNMLEYHEFTDTMVGASGDTVYIDPSNIDPDSRFLCSNGLTYTYMDFSVPEDLYVGESRIEGESLLDSIGANSFAWKEGAEAWGAPIAPYWNMTDLGSEGYVATVNFGTNFEGEWGLRFHFTNVFPMKYRLVWRSSFRPSGIFRITVNGQVMEYKDRYGRTFEYVDTWDLSQTIRSVTGDRFVPDDQFNSVDFWVESVTEFGEVEIVFEYLGPGAAENNGFLMDYVALIPAD